MQWPIVHTLQRFPCGVGTYYVSRRYLCLCGTCCGSVGDEWRTTTIWFPTHNWIFLFTDASQKLCCPQYPVRLVWTLCPGLNLLHTSLRPLSKSWICGVLYSRRLYFTVWYWEICFFYCAHCSGYSNHVCCVWCYNVLGNSVNRGTAHFFLFWS